MWIVIQWVDVDMGMDMDMDVNVEVICGCVVGNEFEYGYVNVKVDMTVGLAWDGVEDGGGNLDMWM